jgi:hypothetical protein
MSKIGYVPTAAERHAALVQMERWRKMAQATPISVQVWRGAVWATCNGFLVALIWMWW